MAPFKVLNQKLKCSVYFMVSVGCLNIQDIRGWVKGGIISGFQTCTIFDRRFFNLCKPCKSEHR